MHDTPTQRFLMDFHPGYRDLSEPERIALNDFYLLFPVFEGTILGPRYTNDDVLKVPETLGNMGVLDGDPLAAEVAYFKARYFQGGAYTQAFHGLHIDRAARAHQQVIRAFLEAAPGLSPVEALKGVLLICFRLRNNAFHGVKALYGYVGQLHNFSHAAAVILFILQHHPRRY